MKKNVFLIIALLLSISIFAQNVITGTVTENGSKYPLIGVNVIVEGTAIGVTTNNDGKYSINVKPEYKNLVFSYIGFEDVVEALDGRNVINVILGESSSILDQVVISASKRKEKVLNAPASISIITAEKLATQTALTPIDNMKKTPGVDIMTTGLVSANVNLRGFNGIFNGSMLTMVDNRIGRVPSLRVNAFQLIPGNNYDYEKIEIIRGPGSALYGPNAADGVMHIITKSPLDIAGKMETVISLTGGIRNVVAKDSEIPAGATFSEGDIKTVIKPEFRTAIKVNDNFGFKVSGRYMAGQDMEFYEPNVEPPIGQTVAFGSAIAGEPWIRDESIPLESFDRDFSLNNYNLDFRADYRLPNQDSELIFAAGNSKSANLELTGLGAARTSGWNYNYGQVRFRKKNFFAQYFINSSNAGDKTYLIPRTSDYADDTVQLQLLIDKSQLNVFQLQNSNQIDKLNLIYGMDFLATNPRTEGTINGRNEDFDNFNQVGAYAQGEYEFSQDLKVVAAARLDYTDIIDEYQVSPRVAVVYKPDPKHTLRATYNKAFSTPSNFAYSLDLANGRHPLWNGTNDLTFNNGKGLNPQSILMDIGGYSNSAGYNYDRDANGNLEYTNFWTGENASLTNTENNHVYFQNMLDVLTAQFVAAAPEDLKGTVPNLLNTIFIDIKGENGTIQDANLSGIDFVEFLSNGDATASLYEDNGAVAGDLTNLADFDRQTSETTETYELGYKGILKNKLYLSVDLYYTQKKNIRSGLLTRSPYVVFNPEQFSNIISNTLSSVSLDATQSALAYNVQQADALVFAVSGGESTFTSLLEDNPEFVIDTDPNTEGVQADGSGVDELEKIMHDLNAQIALGVVTPTNGDAADRGDLVQNDMIVTYVNQGNVDIFGTDIGFTYVFNKDLQLQGAASFVNSSELEAKDDDGNKTGEIVFFNAPAKKFSLGLDHNFPNKGFGYGLNFRITEAYYAQSAPYFGQVNNVANFDAKVFYRPKKVEGLQLTLDINNLFSANWYNGETELDRFQNFPGTPYLGRIAFLNVAYTFTK